MKILDVKNLSVMLKDGTTLIHNISFSLKKNTILGIIGESGSGKSTTIKGILKLLDEEKFNVSGEILLENVDIGVFNEKQMQNIRGKKVSIILQNPMNAFDPLVKIGYQITETLRFQYKMKKKEASSAAKEALSLMEFEDVTKVFKSYPYELSGGMLQRVVIAMALALKPKVLIADEATTALDSETKDSIINEILKLKNKYKISIIYITHESEIIKKISDDIVVLKDGEIIEKGAKKDLMETPKNKYTKSLLQEELIVNEKVKIC